ncbi:MAG: AMP-binding protein [Nibricoccus sp.]
MERSDLIKLALATGCAEERNGAVFLRDPHASESARAQFDAISREAGEGLGNGDGWLCLPTGGTSGGLRFARHDEETLSAAVVGFCAHFGVARVNALDVLPAYHVSGFMSRVRCFATAGEHSAWLWKQLEAGEWPDLEHKEDGWFLSLVPTQLQRLLASDRSIEKLREFRTVFLGGGPMWPELAEAAAAANVPVSICYGMTETAAMVVVQRAGEFLSGDRSCGQAMPHARIEIVDENTGVALPPRATGLVRISGASVCRGYWPAAKLDRSFLTEDLGRLDSDGALTLLGRRDAVIITGGKKVHPLDVEAALRSSAALGDFAVVGIPDPEWGSVVVVCYAASGDRFDKAAVEKALQGLESYKWPKRFVAVSPWPRNAQGKINRAALVAAATGAPARTSRL